MAQRNRYCIISKCKYFTGTKSDQNVHMFRYTFIQYSGKRKHQIIPIKYSSIPVAPENLRAKWIHEIENANGKKFNGYGRICSLHFEEKDYEVRGNKFKLGKDVYPKIYENPKQDAIDLDGALDCIDDVCSNCEILKAENERLKIFLKNLQMVSTQEKEDFEKKMKSVLDENHEKSNQISTMKMEIASLKQTLIRSEQNALDQSKVFLIFPTIYEPELLILISISVGSQK